MKKLIFSIIAFGWFSEAAYIEAMYWPFLIDLSHQNVTDLNPMAQFASNPQSFGMNLSDNNLKDLSLFKVFNESKISSINLSENHLIDLHGLPNSLPHLKSLDLSNNSNLQSLFGLPLDSHLQNLNLSDCGLQNIRFLNDIDLSELKELTLRRCNLNDLTGFPFCPMLKILSLEGNNLQNLEGLTTVSFPYLEELYLIGNPLIANSLINFPWNNNMRNLQSLWLSIDSYTKNERLQIEKQVREQHPNTCVYWSSLYPQWLRTGITRGK